MKRLCFIILFSIITLVIYSQEYMQALGVRGGITSGLTYKKFLNQMKSMEAILSFKNRGMQVTALRQLHELTLFEFSDKFYFMKGYGIHGGYYYKEPSAFLKFKYFDTENRIFSPIFGLDGYLGLEYRFDNVPLVIGLDYKPFFEFSIIKPFDMNIWDTAFYLKYVFN